MCRAQCTGIFWAQLEFTRTTMSNWPMTPSHALTATASATAVPLSCAQTAHVSIALSLVRVRAPVGKVFVVRGRLLERNVSCLKGVADAVAAKVNG